jgi:hypothetical protein
MDYSFAVPEGDESPGRRPWVRVSWDGMPCPVEVRLAPAGGGGGLVCTGLRLGPDDPEAAAPGFAITARQLRQVPLNDILIGALRVSLLHGHAGFASVDPEDLEEATAIQRALAGPLGGRRPVGMAEAMLGRNPQPYRPPQLRPGRRGWPREHYEGIARDYNEIAARNARDPMAELARQLDKPLATVRRWVASAQDMGIPVNRRQRSAASQRARQVLVGRLEAALVFKGMSEPEALAWLERDGYVARGSLFDVPAARLQDLLAALEDRPDVDLPVSYEELERQERELIPDPSRDEEEGGKR